MAIKAVFRQAGKFSSEAPKLPTDEKSVSYRRKTGVIPEKTHKELVTDNIIK